MWAWIWPSRVFQVHGVDRAERPAWCQGLKRSRWITELERNVEPGCEIGTWGPAAVRITGQRLLQSEGYLVKLIAPQFVKPYVKSNKNDGNEAQAIPLDRVLGYLDFRKGLLKGEVGIPPPQPCIATA